MSVIANTVIDRRILVRPWKKFVKLTVSKDFSQIETRNYEKAECSCFPDGTQTFRVALCSFTQASSA